MLLLLYKRFCLATTIAIGFALFLRGAQAAPIATVQPWENLLQNTGNSFTGYNSLYHVSAVTSTAGIVYSGGDAAFRDYFRTKNPLGGTTTADTAAIVGAFWHIAPAIGMYTWGLGSGDGRLASAGAAGVQALAITTVLVQTEKYVTGRRAPVKGDPDAGFSDYERSDDPTDFDARFWQFGDGRSGRHMWPSGHTATAAAFTAAMHSYYEDAAIALVGYPLTLLMGLAMIEGDFHWLSDVVAGALTGMAVGYTVGSNFRKTHRRRQRKVNTTGASQQQNLATRVWQLKFGLLF